MKKNTKIALGVVGIALVGYYIWHKNKASKLVTPAPSPIYHPRYFYIDDSEECIKYKHCKV